MAHILLESSMVEQIMRSAINQPLIEQRIHSLYILANGIFYIITLRMTMRKFIHTQLLMKEAISRLDTILTKIYPQFGIRKVQ